MSVMPTLRTGDVTESFYVDTPGFSYADWLSANPTKLGDISNLSEQPSVAVIGAGVSGLCAAYELAKIGFKVDVYEATSRYGGRLYSYKFSGSKDIIELGAMRFPPSEFVLNYYLEKFGIGNLNDLAPFPDPGVNNTYICYGYETPQVWNASTSECPSGFETVFDGWNALLGEGLYNQSGELVLMAPSTITEYLATSSAGSKTGLAVAAWQKWIDTFGQTSFYTGLFQIFTGAGGYRIPGVTAWTEDDFERFATLGIGSGGFGPLYAQGFTEILRIVINQLETTQKELPSGISSLTDAFYQELTTTYKSSVTISTSAPVSAIINPSIIVNPDTPLPLVFQLYNGTTKLGTYDRVIMATPARAMELTTNLTNFDDSARYLLDQDVKAALKYTHTLSSNKIAARIKKFWTGDDGDQTVRTLLCNSAVLQVYTIDYGEEDTGVCFISYTWEDDAIKQQALGMTTADGSTGAVSKEALYKALLTVLNGLGDDIKEWAKNLTPLDDDYETNVQMIEWQRQPYTLGAFKLAYPGQDSYVQSMYYDYLKALDRSWDTGVYVASDGMDWNAGWVEGAFHPALNAVAAVVESIGGTVATYSVDDEAVSPLSLSASTYSYFPESPSAPDAKTARQRVAARAGNAASKKAKAKTGD